MTPDRIPALLYRLEVRWEREPERSLVGILTKIGGGRLPSDEFLWNKLRSEVRTPDDEG